MRAYLKTTLPVERADWRALPTAGHHVILHGVSWETYERLLAEHEESSSMHFTYDHGTLEIMLLSPEHENYSDVLVLFVNILAIERGIDINSFGSATFRREDFARGFEPDACFYIQNETKVLGKKRLDLRVDPPPDMVIEVDVTHQSLNKFPIFAGFGIPEVWRYDGERMGIFLLTAGQYLEQAESKVWPKVTGKILTEFVDASQYLKRTDWVRRLQTWARRNLP